MGVVRRHRPAACELADPDRAGEDGHEAERDQSGRHQPLPLRGRRHATLALADEVGIEALSMRTLAERLGVVPMALYKHVANKDELLDGMVDVIVGEIDLPAEGADWKDAVRQRILSARRSLLSHRWAPQVIESHTHASPAVLDRMDSLIGLFRAGGFSVDLTHHAMHALGIRMWGFPQEVFPTPTPHADPDRRAAVFAEFGARYPHIVEMATAASHDEGSTVGGGCDDQFEFEFEFEFALDLLLDGFEKLHQQGWRPPGGIRRTRAAVTEP